MNFYNDKANRISNFCFCFSLPRSALCPGRDGARHRPRRRASGDGTNRPKRAIPLARNVVAGVPPAGESGIPPGRPTTFHPVRSDPRSKPLSCGEKPGCATQPAPLGFVLKTHRPFAPPHSPTSFIPILSFVRSGFPGPNLNHAPAGVCQMKIKIELSSFYSKQTNMQVFSKLFLTAKILRPLPLSRRTSPARISHFCRLCKPLFWTFVHSVKTPRFCGSTVMFRVPASPILPSPLALRPCALPPGRDWGGGKCAVKRALHRSVE